MCCEHVGGGGLIGSGFVRPSKPSNTFLQLHGLSWHESKKISPDTHPPLVVYYSAQTIPKKQFQQATGPFIHLQYAVKLVAVQRATSQPHVAAKQLLAFADLELNARDLITWPRFLFPCHTHMAMGENPNRTPSEHPNPH